MARERLSLEQAKHGTVTGYTWHIVHKEFGPPCQPCKDANSKASRDYKERKRKEAKEASIRQKAWWQACSRLAQRYPAEFRELLAEEMKDVPPIETDEEQGEAT